MELQLHWTGKWRWLITVRHRDGEPVVLAGGCCGEYRAARSSGRRALRRLVATTHKTRTLL